MKTSEKIFSLINNGNNKAFRELYGNDSAELKRNVERYVRLLNQFEKEFGKKEVELFSSPGRTEIGGNHTDHNWGRVLAGAVNLDNICVASKNNTSMIRIISEGYPAFKVDLTSMEPRENERYSSAALIRGICSRFRELGYIVGGFDACIDGGVPKGSGLSSSASFEVLIGVILNELFNNGKMDPIQNAIIGQYSENNYFGKPCGLMDQVACAMGGLITIDFEDPSNPIVKRVNFDFDATGFLLVITDTGGSHADLNDEYASIPADMKAVAAQLGANVLRKVKLEQILQIAPEIREKVGDRAILRAIHFHTDNQRVVDQVNALERNDFKAFLGMVVDSGYSSYMYNQNIFAVINPKEQGVSIALALSELILKEQGAWRVHGGGFAGTIQAFVPRNLLEKYINTLEHFFGTGSCRTLFIRHQGAGKVEL
ncbi:MAG: galactokinase [Bacteroidales bacterium]